MVNQRNVSKATAKSKQGAGRDASEQKIKLLKVNVELNEKEKAAAKLSRLPAPRNTSQTLDGE